MALWVASALGQDLWGLTFMCFAWTSFSFMAPGDWTNLLEKGTVAAAARPVVGVSGPPEPKVITGAMPGLPPRGTQGQELKPLISNYSYSNSQHIQHL